MFLSRKCSLTGCYFAYCWLVFAILILIWFKNQCLESDFDPGNATVTFGPMDMFSNFTIKINDDSILETTEQFNLSLVIPDVTKDRGVEEGAPYSAIARILNDDSKELHNMYCSKDNVHH